MSENIRKLAYQLPIGTRVQLRLQGGQRLEGLLSGISDSGLEVDGRLCRYEAITRVLLPASSSGPE